MPKQLKWRLPTAVVAAAIVVIVLLMVVTPWEWLWGWLGSYNGKETNSETARNAGLIPLSALAVALTLWRIAIAQREARTSQQNLELNQYARASERLSSDSMAARLSAIHEIRDLTRQDLEQFHVRTMQTLCAFVRYPPEDSDSNLSDAELCDRTLRPDVQVAMEVIGERTDKHLKLESDVGYAPDLSRAVLVRLELRNSNLSKIDFRGCIFWGADLIQTNLSESELQHTDFRSPWIIKGQDWERITNQEGSFLETTGAVMTSLTRLIGTDLSNTRMLGADLSGCNLQSANASNSNLPDTNLTNAFLVGTKLADAELLGADLTGAVLPGADLSGASLQDAVLSGTDFSGATGRPGATKYPVKGLTQAQLDQAWADPNNPPNLDESGSLVWNDSPMPENVVRAVSTEVLKRLRGEA